MICYIFLDNGVMTTLKRRILSFVFTFLCFKKSLLIRKKKQEKTIKRALPNSRRLVYSIISISL